jgi:hypothetical protein
MGKNMKGGRENKIICEKKKVERSRGNLSLRVNKCKKSQNKSKKGALRIKYWCIAKKENCFILKEYYFRTNI